jgi:hypothetical protein
LQLLVELRGYAGSTHILTEDVNRLAIELKTSRRSLCILHATNRKAISIRHSIQIDPLFHVFHHPILGIRSGVSGRSPEIAAGLDVIEVSA